MALFSEEPLNTTASDGYGYFPAFPGLKLDNDRYEVVYKLGFGPRSSVWLVEDAGQARFVALKILTVHASKHADKELEVLNSIKEERLSGLPLLQVQFTAESSHGKHLCIGLAVLGASVEDLRLSSPSKTLPVHVVQKAIGSMIEPLNMLHTNSIIHGAVKAENMLFYAGQAHDEIKSDLQKLPPCTIENKVVVDGVEFPLVRSHPLQHGYKWDDKKEKLAHSSIYLNNVAHACAITARTRPTWSGVDNALRPPEVILETSFDVKVDVWMLGAAAFQLLTGEPLVPPERIKTEGDQLAWIQAMAGDRFKEEIALRSRKRRNFFDEQGIFVEEVPEDSIASRLEQIGSLSPEERQGVAQFIEQCISLDPADRPTIDDLRYHPWLQPGYACSCGYCG